MTKAIRSTRKASDADIIRLNSMGLSLTTIGKELGCHHTTIKQRLESLNIDPADTRRAFMEDIINTMPDDMKDWLAGQLGPGIPIKTYVQNLLKQEYISSKETPANDQ